MRGFLLVLVSSASLTASIASLCGIFVYRAVTSIVTRNASGGMDPKSVNFSKKSLVSFT